jgi:hypothetical protein
MTTATVGAFVLWAFREVWGHVVNRKRAKTIADAVAVGTAAAAEVAKIAAALHIDPAQLLERLRGVVYIAAHQAGLTPAQVDKALEVAKRELGRLMLEDAFAELGRQVDKHFPGGKLPPPVPRQ